MELEDIIINWALKQKQAREDIADNQKNINYLHGKTAENSEHIGMLEDRMDTNEGRITVVENDTVKIANTTTMLQAKANCVENKLDKLEDRLARQEAMSAKMNAFMMDLRTLISKW